MTETKAPALQHKKIRPVSALKGAFGLMKDKENTECVWITVDSLSGNSFRDNYYRFFEIDEREKLYQSGAELQDLLMDESYLSACTPNSVGHSYNEFMAGRGFSSQGLVDAGKNYIEGGGDPKTEWFGRRLRDQHDIWHVLAGYGTDPLGELCLLAFTAQQRQSLGHKFLHKLGGAFLQLKYVRAPLLRAIREAAERGKNSDWLPGVIWENLFDENLHSARQTLGLPPPTVYREVITQLPALYADPDDELVLEVRLSAKQILLGVL